MTEHEDTAMAVRLKLPLFYVNNASFWFHYAKQQFIICNISSDAKKIQLPSPLPPGGRRPPRHGRDRDAAPAVRHKDAVMTVRLKLPLFYVNNASFWLHYAEQQFVICNISRSLLITNR